MSDDGFVVCIVNGEDVVVERKDAPLSVMLEEALVATQNLGRPSDDWEVRDSSGSKVDTSSNMLKATRSGDTMFMSLSIGFGGDGGFHV